MKSGPTSVITAMGLLLVVVLLVSTTSAQISQPSANPPLVPQSWTLSPLLQRVLPQRPGGQGRAVTLSLPCPRENETMPYWIDPTCISYLACRNHNLTLQQCQQDTAYSQSNHSCLPKDQVNCSAQNEEFSTLVHNFLRAHFFSNVPPSPAPFAALIDNRVVVGANRNANRNADSNADNNAIDRQAAEGEEGAMTIDLDDLPSIVVDSSNSLNVTLDNDTCVRVGSHLSHLETAMNMAVLMLTGCPQQSCDVTLFKVIC